MICILHGISIGLAIDLSTCADVRICAADARLAVKEVDIGLAADIGTLSRLPKCVGSFSWVKDVCLSARYFDAREALAVGFVSQVHENKAAALEAGLKMAGLLASKSPVAVQGTKELLNHARDHSVDESRLNYTSAGLDSLHQAGAAWANCYYHRSAVHRDMEPGHVAVRRCLCGAAIWHTKEEADLREAVNLDNCIAPPFEDILWSRLPGCPWLSLAALLPVCVPAACTNPSQASVVTIVHLAHKRCRGWHEPSIIRIVLIQYAARTFTPTRCPPRAGSCFSGDRRASSSAPGPSSPSPRCAGRRGPR